MTSINPGERTLETLGGRIYIKPIYIIANTFGYEVAMHTVCRNSKIVSTCCSWCTSAFNYFANWPIGTLGFCLPGKGDGNSTLSCCPKVNLAYIRVQVAARGTRSLRRTSHVQESIDSLCQQTIALETSFSSGREVRSGWRRSFISQIGFRGRSADGAMRPYPID